ncbi:MAG: outer membrane beta-barrel protein [Myxococcota bacterium]
MREHSYRRASALIATILVACCAPALAFAGPGDGLKAGDLTLVPQLTLSGGYDSNVFRLADEEYEAFTSRGSARGRITPSLDMSTPEDRFFVFNFGSSVTWEQYFNPNATTRSQSGLSTNIGLGAALNKSGNFSLSVDDSFERTNEPPPAPSSESYNRYSNSLGVNFGIHPGARIIESDLSYTWSRYWHETDELEILNRDQHRFGLNTKYNFLPKTGVFLNATYGLIRYDEPTTDPDPASTSGVVTNVNSQPLRLTAGVSGLITPRLSVKGSAGYGWAFYDAGDTFAGVIGSAALGYAYGRMDMGNILQLGYKYAFDDFSLGNFYTTHRMFLKWKQNLVEKRLGLNAEVSFDIRDYSFDPGDVPDLAGGTTYDDQLLSAGAGFSYKIKDWWSAGADYQLRWNFTDNEFLFGDPADPETPSIPVLRRYMQHQVFVSTTLRY